MNTLLEDKVRAIEIELSLGMIEELISRGESMGLTAEEYAVCVVGQYLKALGN